jgi:HK97 family phage prohead protease
MSETLIEESELELEGAEIAEGETIVTPEEERFPLARTYEAVEIAADGRNVEMLCAPFNVAALVADPPPYGDGRPYEEEFAYGAFSRAARAPNRTLLEFEHWAPGLAGVIGHAAHLEEKPDALYGRFRVLKGNDGDKALELVHAGVLRAASVFFAPLKSARTAAGRTRRLLVKLERVSLCREGSYPQAGVLAVRTAPIVAETIEPASVLPAFDPELAAKAASLGLAVPDRLRAA